MRSRRLDVQLFATLFKVRYHVGRLQQGNPFYANHRPSRSSLFFFERNGQTGPILGNRLPRVEKPCSCPVATEGSSARRPSDHSRLTPIPTSPPRAVARSI